DRAEGIDVVGEPANGKELLELVQAETPDIALIDIRMPEMDGLEAARELRDHHPTVGVIMLTAYDDRQCVVEAVRSGARGYVLKARDAEHLIQTVRLVAGGDMGIDPQLVVAHPKEVLTRKDGERPQRERTRRGAVDRGGARPWRRAPHRARDRGAAAPRVRPHEPRYRGAS